jgi:hypothetical protein
LYNGLDIDKTTCRNSLHRHESEWATRPNFYITIDNILVENYTQTTFAESPGSIEMIMDKRTQITFWVLVGVFIILIGIFVIPVARELVLGGALMLGAGIAFLVLGALLLYFTLRSEARGLLKNFLLTTGASAVGIPISILLHNLVYGLFIHFFGDNFWDRIGTSDEPAFFVLATIVCPLAFVVGVIGSIVIKIRK